jgi:hypothetical protein
MKHVLNSVLFTGALLVAAVGFAQSATSPQKGDEDQTPVSPSTNPPSSTDTNSTGTTDTTGPSANVNATPNPAPQTSNAARQTFTGTVRTLNAGEALVITMANGQTQTFDLSNSPALAASIAVGKRVRVKQSTDAGGRTVITVEPYR